MLLKKNILTICLICSTTFCEPVLAAYTPSVSSGTVKDEIIDDGGTQTVGGRGTVENTTIHRGNQYVYGTANNTYLSGEGRTVMIVYGNGVANGTIVTNKDPTTSSFLLVPTGTANNTTLHSKTFVQIGYEFGSNNSGTMQDTTVISDGEVHNRNGTDINTIINDVGVLEVGTRRNTSLTSTAQSINATINGGTMNIDNGGQSTGATINTRGVMNISSRTNAGTVSRGGATDSIVYGKVNNSGGTDTNTAIKSGGILQLSADAISTGATIESGGLAVLVGKSLADQWAIQGQVQSTHAEAIINNAIVADTGSLRLHSGSLKGTLDTQGQIAIYNGAETSEANITQTKGDIYLINNSNNSHDFVLGSLNMEQGRITFGREVRTPNVYSTLTLSSLDGTGDFFIRTSIAGLQGDFLNVTGIANGNFNIMVADTGVSPLFSISSLSDESLLLVQTGGGNAQFNLSNPGQVVDLGTYQYELQANDKGGWLLTPRSILTPSAEAVISSASIDTLVFQAEMNSVQGRMEEVRSFSHDNNLWMRAIGNDYNISDANHNSYDINTNGTVVGIDGTTENSQVTTTRGLFASYSHSKANFNRGGSNQINSYSLGAYTSSLYANGIYWNAVLKANRFNSHINTKMTGGEATDGVYRNMGVGLNLQTGKYYRFNNSYLTPYIGLTTFISQGKKYRLSNGMKADMGPQHSAVAETGVKMGHTFKLLDQEIQPYIKLAMASELLDKTHVKVNDDKFKSNLSGARGTVEAGGNLKLGKSISLHVDAAYTGSSRVESPWGANVGVAWSF